MDQSLKTFPGSTEEGKSQGNGQILYCGPIRLSSLWIILQGPVNTVEGVYHFTNSQRKVNDLDKR